MHYRVGLVLGKYAVELSAIANIHLLEGIAGATWNFCQGFKVASVGKLVEIDNRISSVADDVADNCRADKAGATGKEDIYQFLIIIKVGLMIKVEAILD